VLCGHHQPTNATQHTTMASRKVRITAADRRKRVVEALTPTEDNPSPTLDQAAKAAGYRTRAGALYAFRTALRDYPKEAMDKWLETVRDIHVQMLEAHLPIALGKGTAKQAKQISRKDAADVVLKGLADMNKIHGTYAATKSDVKHEVTSFVHEDLVAKLNNLVREEEDSEGDVATTSTTDTDEPSSADEPGATLGTRVP